jgi:hypothetical protein
MYKYFCILGYNTVQSVENQRTFQRNMSQFSGHSEARMALTINPFYNYDS